MIVSKNITAVFNLLFCRNAPDFIFINLNYICLLNFISKYRTWGAVVLFFFSYPLIIKFTTESKAVDKSSGDEMPGVWKMEAPPINNCSMFFSRLDIKQISEQPLLSICISEVCNYRV